ncbi:MULTISPECIES: SAF domain-containing protein [unclassified Psychrobacillus]|uniref:SAF domain-containing protein n=1 Tax=unclassified Psychrobacillus TaxID=2636677 RepID=UPI0030FC6609
MKTNKLLFSVLAVTFILAAAMFYYQNFYKDSMKEEDMRIVYVARTDIPEGTKLGKENIAAIQIPVTAMLSSYKLDYTKNIEGNIASSTIFEHEVIVKERITEKDRDKKQFMINVQSVSDMRGIDKGDTVRIAVIPTEYDNTDLFMVLDKKAVASNSIKVNSSGKETGVIDSVNLLMSEEEAAVFYKASKSGEIIVMEYNTLADAEKSGMQSFNEFITNLPVEETGK